MQFDLLKLDPVINHLKQISPNMYRKLSNELMIHCPFCDDAIRANSANHGHLYLSIESPVFNCFRCNTSGTLISFLLQTGFDDRESISYIGQFIKISFTKDYYKTRDRKIYDTRIDEIRKKIIEINLNFKKNYTKEYYVYLQYLNSRIGLVNYTEFLIHPNIFKNYITCNFNNYIGETVLLRYVNHEKLRYQINKNSSNLYYFQKLDLYDKYNKITFCEGPFDIISLYLYNDYFKDNLFISINGKNYVSIIERFLITDMLFGTYHINLVFDSDFIKKSWKILKIIKNMISVYNGEISFEGHKPLSNVGDVTDFPSVERITYV